ncbi:MAG TPA: sterol desaturase, partial [Flavobacterium sp.]|nr:sterol desaturase [Flavobacterium sp.]
LDKNHGQIFIFWDKWFGTFQEELEAVPPVYGITRPAQTWNPIKINFQHLWLLCKDAWHAKSWKDKFRIWFMPTGWRPEGFEEKYPVDKIEDVYNFEKYNPIHSIKLRNWSIIQLFITLGFVSYMFANIATIPLPNLFLYGAFIFLTIYSTTELMDTNPNAMFWEGFRILFGIGIIIYYQDWFGLLAISEWSNYILMIYFFISFFITLHFVNNEFPDDYSMQFSK